MSLVTRQHRSEQALSTATYSACERYRYALERVWDAAGKRVLFIMLNPSKADEIRNDPTVERCERRARHLGFGAFRVVNIFAWRDTDPHAMRRAKAPIGPENDRILTEAATWADSTIAAWGVHGAHQGRGEAVAKMLIGADVPLLCFGQTKDGHPRHPLYVAYATQPQPWEPAGH